jgi:hypothetical protein
MRNRVVHLQGLSHRLRCGLIAAATASFAVVGCSGTGDTGNTGASTTSAGGSSSSSAGGGGQGGTASSGSTSAGGSGGVGGASTSSGSGGAGAGFDPTAGWTDFTASPDTLKVYVSSSGGSDNNDGLTEATAVKTIAKGKSIVRNNFPDWLLLKRGDVWVEGIGGWTKSGKSAAEPILISTYGDAVERPLLKTGAQPAIQATSPVNYVAIVGLHFYAHTRDPGSPDFVDDSSGSEGIRWVTKSDSLLVEDVMVQFYAGTNITIQGTAAGPITNFKLRRSIIVDAYRDYDLGHSQGIYTESVNGLVIEENFFDHNGWNETAAHASKTGFNHNMYIHVGCKDLVVRRNISMRASSHGLQARPGGMVDENLFVDNPLALSFGLVLGGSSPLPGGVSGELRGNVLRDGSDISDTEPRGYGMEIANMKSGLVEDNIIAHDKSIKDYGAAIELHNNEGEGVGLNNLTIKNNIFYDWRGNLKVAPQTFMSVLFEDNQVQSPGDMTTGAYYSNNAPNSAQFKYSGNQWLTGADAAKWFFVGGKFISFDQWVTQVEANAEKIQISFPDPERTLSKYHGSLGKEMTFDAYVAAARQQSFKNYKYEYTALGPINYIRNGFGRAPFN